MGQVQPKSQERSQKRSQEKSQKKGQQVIRSEFVNSEKAPVVKRGFVGKGGFGSVTRGDWNGQAVALKRVKNESIGLSEFKIVSELNRAGCENIISFLACYEELTVEGHKSTVIVSQLYDGTLYDFRNNHAALSGLLNQALSGLQGLSAFGLDHGDIKPDNILYRKREDDHVEVVIGDFGLSDGGPGGTPMFMSPEGLGQRIVEKSDVYSFGITILLLRYGEGVAIPALYQPCLDPELEAMRKLIQTKPTIRLVMEMIDSSPANRPSLTAIEERLNSSELRNEVFSLYELETDQAFYSQYHLSSGKSRHHIPECNFVIDTTISRMIHDQGEGGKCWAFSIATMLRSSLKKSINRALLAKEISKEKGSKLFGIIDNKSHHKLLRNELMMVIHPIRLNTSGTHQNATIAHVINQIVLESAMLSRGMSRLRSLSAITDLFPVSMTKQFFFNGSSHPAPLGFLLGKCRQYDNNLLNKFTGSFQNALRDGKAIVTTYPTAKGGHHAVVLIGSNEFEIGFKNSYNKDCTSRIDVEHTMIGYYILLTHQVRKN